MPYISDSQLIPINSQGANWALFKSKREAAAKGAVGSSPRPASSGNEQGENRGEQASGLSLANEIRNQMLYYKVLRDKHDNSLINTLQDLNNMLKTGSGSTSGQSD